MSRLDNPPSYDGEMFLNVQQCKLVDDGHGPPCVDVFVEVYQGMFLVEGLQWMRRAAWVQLPIESMWMLSPNAQVPLTVVRPYEPKP